MTQPPVFSIIVPVFNGGDQFMRCLNSVGQSSLTDWELIIVDDGSTDGSAELAQRFGATVIRTAGQQGPAAARNLGARRANGEYLFFTDADCEFHHDTLNLAAQHLKTDPDLDALLGSYDAAPGAPNFFAQYKNLFHHYIHQTSNEDASTFWTGCGAIKRTVFLNLGGFDAQRYRRPAIEDIDLGYRLKRAGGRIRLAKDVQVKHLKIWTLSNLLKSDIVDRGIPWTRLILRHRAFVSDLNLQTHNRVSLVALYGLLISSLVGVVQPLALLLALGLLLLLLWLNSNLYLFFYRQRGLIFTLKAIPIHWLYYFYNAISFGCGLMLHWSEQAKARIFSSPRPLVDGREIDGSG